MLDFASACLCKKEASLFQKTAKSSTVCHTSRVILGALFKTKKAWALCNPWNPSFKQMEKGYLRVWHFSESGLLVAHVLGLAHKEVGARVQHV